LSGTSALGHAQLVDYLLPRGAGDGEHGRQPAGDPLLHPREAVPAADGGPAPAAGRGVQVELPVDGDGVVDRRDQGHAEAQLPVAERLVVVDDVELATTGGQMASRAQREGQRLGEAAGPHRGHFERVDPVPVLAGPRGAEGVRLPVEVEAGQLGEDDTVIQHGIRLRPDDLDAVPEPGELAGQMAYVDALAPAEGVALVTEQRDPERPGLCGHSRPPSHSTSAGA
jgi:hypothetical protein